MMLRLSTRTSLMVGCLLLSACGWLEPCANKDQAFDLFFGTDRYSTAIYNLALGEPIELRSSITPEACRADMSIAAVGGMLPPGLSIQEGNIRGTPVQEGEWRFALSISKVDGFTQRFAVTSNPIQIRVGKPLSAAKCGNDNEWFDVFLGPTKAQAYEITAKLGQNLSLVSTVIPSACRQAMHFTVIGGNLPPGLKLESGNLEGTPEQLGIFTFFIGINAVTQYESYNALPQSSKALSNAIVLTVTPP